jgi:hypothetical protein
VQNARPVLVEKPGCQVPHVARVHPRMLADHGNCSVNKTWGARALSRIQRSIIAIICVV